MKKETKKRKAHRPNVTPTEHDSSISEHVVHYDSSAEDFDLFIKEIPALNQEWDLAFQFNKARAYPTAWLQSRHLPYESRAYYFLPDGTESKKRPSQGVNFYGYNLVGLIKEKYDGIPGAKQAAEALSKLSFAEECLKKGEQEKAAVYLLQTIDLTRTIVVAGMEAKWHAGEGRTGSGQEHIRIRNIAKNWLIELRSKGSPPPKKTVCYRKISKRLKDEEKITKSWETIQDWFKSDKSIP